MKYDPKDSLGKSVDIRIFFEDLIEPVLATVVAKSHASFSASTESGTHTILGDRVPRDRIRQSWKLGRRRLR